MSSFAEHHQKPFGPGSLFVRHLGEAMRAPTGTTGNS
jgi:hypothetical protein